MPIPKEILAVERPVNSVVFAYGKNKDRYAVRKRVGCRYDKGRRLPVTGPTIGHIVEGRFVPVPVDDAPGRDDAPPDVRDWGDAALCDRVSRDILDELLSEYPFADAVNIYCIAALRVCRRGIRDDGLKEMYDASFLSEAHPGAALSKNTVPKFLAAVGKGASRIISFMRRRAAAAAGPGGRILIGAARKVAGPKADSLPGLSRKPGAAPAPDAFVLYAFDLDRGEPICSMRFPEGEPDLTAYEGFLTLNGITRGLIVSDAAFPGREAAAFFEAQPGIRFLNPVEKSSKEINELRLNEFDGVLPGRGGVSWKKAAVAGGRWLYAFRDAAEAEKEERDWLDKASRDGAYSDREFREMRLLSGLIVLESNADLPPEAVYEAYAGRRREIGLVMGAYEHACSPGGARVHSDCIAIGSAFCDFLAAVMTFRLIRAFDEARLLEKHSYGRLMELLRRAKKVKLPGKGWCLVRTTEAAREILEKLALLPAPAAETPKRGRGRPRKRPAPPPASSA